MAVFRSLILEKLCAVKSNFLCLNLDFKDFLFLFVVLILFYVNFLLSLYLNFFFLFFFLS